MSDEQEPPEPGPAWAPYDPYAGDPPPGAAGPSQQDPYGAQPGPYGGPQGSPYGGPSSDPYGVPQQGPYGVPQQGPYGVPQQGPYGGQPSGPYGAPPQTPHGAPQQTPYGGPQQSPYGGPQSGPYGMPQQEPYGAPQQGPYGAPQQAPYGAPQQGPYGAPQPGAPGWAPAGGPGRPGNNRPLIISAIAGGLVLAILVAVWIGVSGGGAKNDKPAQTAAAPTNSGAATNAGSASAAQVAQSLGALPGLRYSGTFTSGGDAFQARLSVTKAGSAIGTISGAGGAKARIVSVNGATYLKASASFWRGQGGVTANAADYAGHWAKAPESALNLDIKNVLAAGAVVQGLRGAGSAQQAGGTENINGTPAIKVTGTDAEYYLSTANPPKLLRIAGIGTDAFRFDVAEVSAAEAPALFQQLHDAVSALAGALDPSVHFTPASRIKGTNCGTASCTMTLTVIPLSVGGSSRFRAIMLGKITQGSASGRTLGTCSDSATGSSGQRITLSCTVRGGAYATYRRTTVGLQRWSVQARIVAAAVDVGSLVSAVDQERQGA